MKSLLLLIVALLVLCSKDNPNRDTVEEPKSPLDGFTTLSIKYGLLSMMRTDGTKQNDLDKPIDQNSTILVQMNELRGTPLCKKVEGYSISWTPLKGGGHAWDKGTSRL